MRIKIIIPIKVNEISKQVLPIGDTEYEMSDSGGEVLVRKGFAIEVENKQEIKLKAAEIIEIVEKVTDVKDLEKFESDTRATVKEAIKVRKAELNPE